MLLSTLVEHAVRYNFVLMNTRPLAAKFHIPPWRATQLPNAGLHEGRKLTLISAPAGYGKTTLIAEWIHSLTGGAQRVAWLSLDPEDNDPGRFFLPTFWRRSSIWILSVFYDSSNEPASALSWLTQSLSLACANPHCCPRAPACPALFVFPMRMSIPG